MNDRVRSLAPVVVLLVLSRAWSTAVVFVAAAIPGGHVDLAAAPLFAWDGEWYVQVAENGYHAEAVAPPAGYDVAFFPLWPLVIRVASLGVFPLDVTAVAAGTTLFVLAGVLVHRLFSRIADPVAALPATTLWAFAPPAYTASIGYAEPAFVLSAAAFFLERRPARQFALALIAMLTRLTGLALAPAALAWRGRRWLALAPLLGMAAWVGWLAWMSGDPGMYLKGSPSWYGGDAHGLPGLWQAALDLDWYVAAVVLVLATFVAGGVRLLRAHLPLALFSLACVAMTVLTAIPESMPRHGWAGIGAFLGLGLMLPGRRALALVGMYMLTQVAFALGALWAGLTP